MNLIELVIALDEAYSDCVTAHCFWDKEKGRAI
jgi:hypothetical protein